jgi:hypothetical protein
MIGIGKAAGDRLAGRRGVAIAAAELLGLSALVIAQPIFDALKRSTYAFPTAGVGGFDLVLLAAALLLVPPALMLTVELLAGLLSRPLRGWVHLGWIGLLVALLCWQALAHADEIGRVMRIAIPAAAFGAAGFLYIRYEAARQLCGILAFAAPVVAVLFLFTPPIRDFTFLANPDIPEPQIHSKTPVVLIVFDEFPLAALLDSHRRIDAKRFPNFAALAKGSDWFQNAVTVADTTEQAVPAILSGDLPQPNGIATYADHPRNIFTLLGSSFESNISESATNLCPPKLCARRKSLIDRLAPVTSVGLATADSFPFHLGTRIADKLNQRYPLEVEPDQQVAHFLAGIRPHPGGSLNVMHVQLPHVPWQYMPSGRRYQTDTDPLGETQVFWAPSPGYVIQGLQRETLQIQYTDRVLGRIVARLRRAGLYKRALVAVVADHGSSFIPSQSRRIVGPANAGWILRVPLFVKKPGQRRGRTVTRPVRTIDLLPTIADVLNIRIPWKVDGRSLLGRPSTQRLNTYMRYREDLVHISPATVDRGFFSAIAVRNGFLGSGDIFTLGASRRDLRRQLHGAKRLDVALENPGGTTYDPGSGTYPSLVYGRILDPPPNEPDRLIATLNGRIVAVAESLDGGTGFTTLIPPSAFRPGANRLAIYAP